MQYKLVQTSLFHKRKLIPENSIVEMPENEASEYSEYLIPITETKTKTTTKKTKTKNTNTQ